MTQIEVQEAKMYKTTTSFSHVLGNITVIIEDYIKSIMPKDYFKQSRATTEVAFKDIRDFRKNLIQSEKPYLVLDPKFLTDQESEALPQIHWDKFAPIDHTSSPNIYLMNHEFFLKHDEGDFALGYTFNRYRLQFGVTMIVETQMKRLSLINYLRSNLRFRHTMPLQRYTETLIPRSYIKYMSNKLNMDIHSSDFLAELNRHSRQSIVKLHRPATDTTEFFVLSPTELQLRIPDLPTEDTVRAGRIERYSSAAFQIDVELNVMNNFLLLTRDYVDVPDDELSNDYMVRICIESRTPVLDRVKDGKTVYTKIAVEFDNNEEDIDLKKFVGNDIINALKYIEENELEDDYAKFVVYKWNDEVDLSDPEYGEVDYKKFSMKLKKLEKETLYHIFIYIDMNYIKKISKFINEDTLPTTGKDYEKVEEDGHEG